MTSQRRPTFVLFIIAVFFVAGVMTVVLGGDASESPGTPSPGVLGESVLVLGVDDLTAQSPRLVAVWHASFSPDGRELLLLGDPVDRPVCDSQAENLQQLFLWDPEHGVAEEFLSEFGDKQLTAYVVADEVAFAGLIDQLSGVELNGALLESDQVIAVMRSLYQNPAGLLTSQEQFLIALSQRGAEAGSRVDLNSLVELIPRHAYSSVPPQQLFTLYLRLQPLDSSSILVFAPPTSPPTCDG